MTSQKQIDANRRNALLSTGPRTENGKQRSRGNAYCHGLTAATVIVGVEDAAEYAAFEAEIVSEYDPKSVIERELTRRLASLLWRLRRANLIETGLLSIALPRSGEARLPDTFARWFCRLHASGQSPDLNRRETASAQATDGDRPHHCEAVATDPRAQQRAIMLSFLQLENLSSQTLERVSRYETALWRQFVQVLLSLDQAKYHRIAASRGRFTPYPPQW